MNHSPSLNGYFVKLNHEITLTGTNDEVKTLGEKLLEDESVIMTLNVPDDSPAPYDGYLVQIQFVSSHGPLQLEINEGVLIIKGSPEKRRQFAKSLLQTAREPGKGAGVVKRRLQIKYEPHHQFLAATTLTVNINIIDLSFDCGEVDLPEVESPTLPRSQRRMGPDFHINTVYKN